MAITKPTVDSATWGNTNTSTPDMVTPGAGLVNTGFLPYPTKLKRGHLNWLFNKVHSGLRYYMSRGLPEWDATEAQYAVASVVQYNGAYYRLATASPAGTAPDVDTAHWSSFFAAQTGVLLARRVITASGNYAKTAGTTRARFRMVGGGGGSAGVCAALGPGKWSSGGAASGSWGEFETTTIPAVNWVAVIGALGPAGSAPAGDGAYNAGTAGGATTLSDGTNTFTCPGGGSSSSFTGGAPGGIPTASGGTIIFAADGERGGEGQQHDAVYGVMIRAGDGGGTPFGAGGRGRSLMNASLGVPQVPYAAPIGKGGGGQGVNSYNASTGAGNGAAGVDGSPGWIVLEEWS